jgi:hypothetical protein
VLTTHRFRAPKAIASVFLAAALFMVALAVPNPVSKTRVAHAAAPVFGNNNGSVPHNGLQIFWIQANNATRLGTLPEPGSFTVTANGQVIPVVSVTLTSEYLLDLNLTSAITSGAVVTFSYTAPPIENPVTTTNKALQDLQGNDALSFGPLTVLNTSIVSPIALPAAPTIVAGPESVTATVTAPASGVQPSWHRVQANPGGRECDIETPSGSCTISGLTAGTSYTFTVRSYDNNNRGTTRGTASAPVTVLAKTVAPVTNVSTDTTAPPVASAPPATPDSNAPSWDVDPATESETDAFTEGFWPSAIPGNIIITNEVGFTVDAKNGIRPKIRMKNYAGKIKMTISATYKDGAKTKKYKCTYAPFGSTKKVKTAKWKWYTPKKACILPKALVTAIQTGTATLNAKGKWTRTWVTSGKKARPDKTKIKPRTLKYTVRAKPAAVK